MKNVTNQSKNKVEVKNKLRFEAQKQKITKAKKKY